MCTCIGTQRFIVKIMAVIQITSREFREKQASMFALADKGAQVVIRRRGKVSYLLTPVYDNDYVLSPEVEERLEGDVSNIRKVMLRPVKQKRNLMTSWNRYEPIYD